MKYLDKKLTNKKNNCKILIKELHNQGLVEQQQRGAIPQQNPAQLADTLSNLSAELANTDDEEAGEKIKSWIEQG